MKILASKNKLHDTTYFLTKVYREDYIDGAVLNVNITQDGKIIIFNLTPNNANGFDVIQTKRYDQLKSDDVMLLEDALTYLVGIPKKIVLNIIPLSQNILAKNSLEERANKNARYIEKISEIVNKFPRMDIYIASTSNKIMYHVKYRMPHRKKGLVYTNLNMGYEDLDFYIFVSSFYDVNTFLELLKLKKEIMIYILNTEIVTDSNPNIGSLADGNCSSIYYISEHPEIIHKLFG